jgi:hypothetical protein
MTASVGCSTSAAGPALSRSRTFSNPPWRMVPPVDTSDSAGVPPRCVMMSFHVSVRDWRYATPTLAAISATSSS